MLARRLFHSLNVIHWIRSQHIRRELPSIDYCRRVPCNYYCYTNLPPVPPSHPRSIQWLNAGHLILLHLMGNPISLRISASFRYRRSAHSISDNVHGHTCCQIHHLVPNCIVAPRHLCLCGYLGQTYDIPLERQQSDSDADGSLDIVFQWARERNDLASRIENRTAVLFVCIYYQARTLHVSL